MKLLELAPYVYIGGHKHGGRNQSGLAYMIRSICDMLATKHEVQVLTQSIFTEEMMVSGWCLLQRSPITIISHFKFKYLKLAFQLYNKRDSLGISHLLLYCISAGQVEDYIGKLNAFPFFTFFFALFTSSYLLFSEL